MLFRSVSQSRYQSSILSDDGDKSTHKKKRFVEAVYTKKVAVNIGQSVTGNPRTMTDEYEKTILSNKTLLLKSTESVD